MKSALALLLAAIVLLSSCAGEEAQEGPLLALRYADNQPEGHPTSLAAERFADLVEERTGGRIEIDVFANGELGDEASIYEQIKYGGVDFSRFSLGTFPEELSDYYILVLPFLYRDSEHMWKVLDGEIGNGFLDNPPLEGMTGLAWLDAGARSIYTVRPVQDVKDLDGLRIRIQENNNFSACLSYLGAECVPLTYDAVYSALQMRTVDGAENNMTSYVLMGHYEKAPYVFMTEHMRIPEMVVISDNAKAKIEALGDGLMEIVETCAREAAVLERELWADFEAESLSTALDSGCVVTYPSSAMMAEMRAAMETCYDSLGDEERGIVERIRAIE